MPHLLKTRFAGREQQLHMDILAQGLSPVCDQEGVSFDALSKYAKEVLHINNPRIITQNMSLPINDLALVLVDTLFQKYQTMQTEILKLRQEKTDLINDQIKRQATTKLQIMQLLEAAKER